MLVRVQNYLVIMYLRTLLEQSELMRANREWPIFKNDVESNNRISLTDQLLDRKPQILKKINR